MTSQTVWANFRARDTRLSDSHSDHHSQTGLCSTCFRTLRRSDRDWNRQSHRAWTGLGIEPATSGQLYYKWWYDGCHSEGSGLSISLVVCESDRRFPHLCEDEQNHPEPPAALCEYCQYCEYYYCSFYWYCYYLYSYHYRHCSSSNTGTSFLFPLVSFTHWRSHHKHPTYMHTHTHTCTHTFFHFAFTTCIFKGLFWCFYMFQSINCKNDSSESLLLDNVSYVC